MVRVTGTLLLMLAKWCLTFCDPMGCSTPGFPLLHHIPKFTPAHVHWVGDAFQPSHPLLPPSPLAFNLPSHGLFLSESALCVRWQSIGVSASAPALPMNSQGWFPFRLTGLILLSKGLSRVSSNTTVWNHQFFSSQPSLWSSLTAVHD